MLNLRDFNDSTSIVIKIQYVFKIYHTTLFHFHEFIFIFRQ